MPKLQSKSKTTLKTGNRAEYDLYPTPRKCVQQLLDREKFHGQVWEPACGRGDISEVLLDAGYSVLSTDIIDHGYENLNAIADFLQCTYQENMPRNIVTNPPFKYATEFMKLGYELTAQSGGKLALFLRLNFLEGQKRFHWFKEHRPSNIYVFAKRQTLWRNGEAIPKGRSGTTAYAWIVWRGKSWKSDDTTFDWIEP
tara:strand:+ start:2773 stop:3366 length:594 start_codon:yes stop_codon:yes gene_type:complete